MMTGTRARSGRWTASAPEGLVATSAVLGIDTGLDPAHIQAAASDVAAILGLPRPADTPDLADIEALIVKRSPSP